MTTGPVAPIVPRSTPDRVPAMASGARDPLPLPPHPVPRGSAVVYGVAVLDNRGRLADRDVVRALGWMPGTPVEITQHDGVLLVRARTGAAVAAQLDEAWFLAQEQLAVCYLKRGEPQAVIDLLKGLLQRQPLRETLYDVLICALHQAGRRAEALEVFHLARHRISTQTGSDVSPMLQLRFEEVLGCGHSPANRGAIPPPTAGRYR